MSSALLIMTLSLSLGQYGGGCSTCGVGGGGGGGGFAAPDYGGGFQGGGGGGGYPLGSVPGASYGTEQLYQYDAYDNWIHGHWQEMPSYGGFHAFRPYNYKHVLSQSQVAAGWGMSSTHPYSQEYFRRLREQAYNDPRRSQYDAAYATELARLRAQRDYQQISAEQPQRGPELAPQRPVDNAVYTPKRDMRRDDLQERIRQQAQQLQALQEEYYRSSQGQSVGIPGSQGSR